MEPTVLLLNKRLWLQLNWLSNNLSQLQFVRRSIDLFLNHFSSEAAALAQAQARGVMPMLTGAPGIARSPTLAVAGAPIVMSPGRGQTAANNASNAVLQLQTAAAAAQNNAAAVAAQQAALLQQQQAAEYQQLLLS